MADWIKCVNEDCQYFREHGECHEVCKDQKIKKIVTNADRIRAMSDEELAEVTECPYGQDRDYCAPKKDCLQCCLEWLQSEAEEPHE